MSLLAAGAVVATVIGPLRQSARAAGDLGLFFSLGSLILPKCIPLIDPSHSYHEMRFPLWSECIFLRPLFHLLFRY